MRRFLFAVVFGVLFFLTLSSPSETYAQSCDRDYSMTYSPSTVEFDPDRSSLAISVYAYGLASDTQYYLYARVDSGRRNEGVAMVPVGNNRYVATFTGNWITGFENQQTEASFEIQEDPGDWAADYCQFTDDFVIHRYTATCSIRISQYGNSEIACYENGAPISISGTINYSGDVIVSANNPYLYETVSVSNGQITPVSLDISDDWNGSINISIRSPNTGSTMCSRSVLINEECDPEDQEEGTGSGDGMPQSFSVCESLTDNNDECTTCLDRDGIWTAIGCIRFQPQGLAEDLLAFGIGAGGGLTLLLLIYGAFLYTTSGGVPEQAQKGREVISGAITGLLFIILSVAILRIVGVDLLRIPGF
jgi:hypothetical protein